jgi:alpha-galactosidase
MKTSISLGQYNFVVEAQSSSQRGSDIILTGSNINLELPFESVAFFSHGWQSWSLTAWLERGQQASPSFPTSLQAMQVDPLYANEKKPNGSWLGAIKTPDGMVLLLGALNLESHVFYEGRRFYGFYEHGEGDWLLAIGSEQEVFYRYATLLGERFGKSKNNISPRIWCSWYSLYK